MSKVGRVSAIYRALPRVDKALVWLLAAAGAGGFLLPAGALAALVRLIFYIAAGWLGLRLARAGIRRAIWSLRNRLLVAYAFIAVVPIVLILALTGLVGYVVLGQTAVYLVTSELERRASGLQSTINFVAGLEKPQRAGWLNGAFSVLRQRYPGLEFLIEDDPEVRLPSSAAIDAPSPEWGEASGLLVRNNLLYAWARVVREDSAVTAVLPLTTGFLATLAPNLGEVTFMRMDESSGGPAPGPQPRLHRLMPGAPSSEFRNRVPPPVNRFDLELVWAAPLPVHVWDTPGKTENELLRVRTRPSALLDIVFAQKVDLAQGIIPRLLLFFFFLFLAAEVVSVLIGVSITRTITSAVHDLYEGTGRVMEGDFSHRIAVKGGDQLASLSSSFNRMTENLERLLRVAKEKERLQAEIEIAREVQNQLYPRQVPAMKTLEVTACCNPARLVSGDYYDYQRIGDHHLALAIGDVAGKGISAALLMATVQSSLRTQIRACLEAHAANGAPVEESFSVSRLVTQLNQHLYANTSPEKYATFCFGVYDDRTGQLTYSNAGHLPPILVRNGRPRGLDVNGMVVGAFPFARYDESRIALERGDLLLFYTDGITEPENEYGEQFGEERLVELMGRNAHRPAAEIAALVLDAVAAWTNSPELQDDMTLLLARRI